MLSAVNLPGGVQRRRTYEDELNMRTFLAEADLISAEVQEIRQDGGVALHTRSLKYGKLQVGELVTVPPQLIKRSQKHFHELPCEVKVILGNNGYVWVQPLRPDPVVDTEDEERDEPEPMSIEIEVTAGERQRIARVRNAVEVLARQFISIHAQTIMDVYLQSEELDVRVCDMLLPDRSREIAALASLRRETT
mmetsp:Transcript_43329/g.106406  ORF Transcript_43329/g.106406 Transcript_43329/m.106406 type:complete len:193 (-) Transcript_43329:282-860(-)